jgi:hypothetical protein
MNTTGRRNRDAAAGTRLVEQYVESGLTQREFCERQRISIGTLQYWLRRIGAGEIAGRRAEPPLVEVKLLGAGGAPKSSNAGSAAEGRGGYEVVLAGERRLRISPGFDAEEVAVLVALLEGRGC